MAVVGEEENEILDMELDGVDGDYSAGNGDLGNDVQVEVLVNEGGHDEQPLSETGSAENSGREFLAKLDKNFICGPRLIVRGEYIGRSDGTDYKLIVRRKTEGTYVDWGLHNMKTKKQILLVRGEMSYPYNLEQKNERRKTYGRYIKGGWSYEGWGYGYLNLNGLSDWFRKDPRRVLHIDIHEALFYDEEVYHLYHVCGPKCKNADKAVGIKCTEGDCGLRIHSVVFTSFTTCSEDHDLRPTSYSKKEEVQSVFMSLVQFFDGQFKVVVHRDPRIRRYDKEVMWMSPAPNLRFNDTVAGVDRKMLEKAQQIFRTSVPRPGGERKNLFAEVISVYSFTLFASCSLNDMLTMVML